MLHDTGVSHVTTLEGENARTKDDHGNIVIVSASHEAVQDYGWDAILDVASNKYDAGEIVPNRNPPLVRVTTADFANA